MQSLKHILTGDTIEPNSNNSVINPFTFAHGSTQVPAPNFKIAESARRDEGARLNVPPWRHALPMSPLRILRSVSTSLKLNCTSSPPVFDWSTCVASPPQSPSRDPRARRPLGRKCLCSQLVPPPKQSNSSQPPRDRFSQHQRRREFSHVCLRFHQGPVELCKLVLKRLLEHGQHFHLSTKPFTGASCSEATWKTDSFEVRIMDDCSSLKQSSHQLLENLTLKYNVLTTKISIHPLNQPSPLSLIHSSLP